MMSHNIKRQTSYADEIHTYVPPQNTDDADNFGTQEMICISNRNSFVSSKDADILKDVESQSAVFLELPTNEDKTDSQDTTPIQPSDDLTVIDESNPVVMKKEALLYAYLRKFKGVEGKKSPPRSALIEVAPAAIFSFIGIFLVSVTSYWYLSRNFEGDNGTVVTLLSGAYGATAGDTYINIESVNF